MGYRGRRGSFYRKPLVQVLDWRLRNGAVGGDQLSWRTFGALAAFTVRRDGALIYVKGFAQPLDWFYAKRVSSLMKTTVDLPDVPRKAEAALLSRKHKDLVEEGLRLVLDSPPEATRHTTLAGLINTH
jgi:hypothetical protein